MAHHLCRSRLVRTSELATRLGVSRVTLWRWERAGNLPPKHQIGPNVVGWLESELDKWFADRADDDHGWAEARTDDPLNADGRAEP